MADLTGREVLTLLPLVLLSVGLGLFPQPVLDTALPALSQGVQRFRREAGWPPADFGPAVPGAADLRPAVDPGSACPFLSQPQPDKKEAAR